MSILSKFKSNKAITEFILTEDEAMEERGFISTGCIPLNILFSGQVDGGLPIGRISQLASISSSGKSFLGMKLAKNAQKIDMDVVYIDTEFAYSGEFAKKVGIDPSRIMVIQDNHIE